MPKEKKEILYPLVVSLEAVLMANGEVLHYGKSLGFVSEKEMDLVESGATKLARGGEIMVALGDNVA
jgi:hypothetical protein